MAHYLYNCPEFMESMFSIYKLGLVPVNTNYRYVEDELVYLWDNADVIAVVFHGTFTDRIEHVRDAQLLSSSSGVDFLVLVTNARATRDHHQPREA